MNARPLVLGLGCTILLVVASPAQGLANRVFVSARSGNNSNACDNVNTPCQTFAGAVTQLNPNGELIVLDSGGYGPVTITQGITIEAPAGVTAFDHPPSGDAITINAGATDTVTLRGLVLNGGSGNGITLNSVGVLSVENCFITGFAGDGIHVGAGDVRLTLKGTDIKACANGVLIAEATGLVQTSIDHCHFDGNSNGFFAATALPGISVTAASNSTANNNTGDGWICGGGTSGIDTMFLEFCSGSANGGDGVLSASASVLSRVVVSNCAFSANRQVDVAEAAPSKVYTRGNNSAVTVTGTSIPQPAF